MYVHTFSTPSVAHHNTQMQKRKINYNEDASKKLFYKEKRLDKYQLRFDFIEYALDHIYNKLIAHIKIGVRLQLEEL